MKKNCNGLSYLQKWGIKKIMLMTKLTLFLSLFCIFQLSASVYSQTTKLSLNSVNKTVKEVFQEIEDQSEYRFFYNEKFMDLEKRINFDISNELIDVVLSKLLETSSVTYKVMENNLIVITPNNSQQTNALSGKVTNEQGESIPGVTVLLKGTTKGTVTNMDGTYSISDFPPDGVIVFSFVGMKTVEVQIAGQNIINTVLIEDAIGLEEVIAIGYGTMKKSDITGSVSSVSTEDLEAVPSYNIEQALKTRSAGVRITQNSGEPGGSIQVSIRGGNSMIGDNSPLYVVDGFAITGGVNFLNPSDIESIDILKDASATAIYGSRGANGVIIITSKRGKKGQKGKIELSSYFGVQQEANRYEMLDAKQYAEVANEWLKNNDQEPFYNLNEVQNPGTNWQDLIFRNAPIQNHTITFSGASASTRYSLSGNYFEQEGIIINSGVKRGSLRLNLDHEVNSWAKMGVNINLSRRENNRVNANNGYYGNNMLSGAMAAPPTLEAYD